MILAVVGHGCGSLETMLTRLNPDVVVTGRFWRTDDRVRNWAIENGITIITVDPNFIRHGSRAMKVRAQQIAMIADEMLVSGVDSSALQAALEMQNAGKMVWNEDDCSGFDSFADDDSFSYF